MQRAAQDGPHALPSFCSTDHDQEQSLTPGDAPTTTHALRALSAPAKVPCCLLAPPARAPPRARPPLLRPPLLRPPGWPPCPPGPPLPPRPPRAPLTAPRPPALLPGTRNPEAWNSRSLRLAGRGPAAAGLCGGCRPCERQNAASASSSLNANSSSSAPASSAAASYLRAQAAHASPLHTCKTALGIMARDILLNVIAVSGWAAKVTLRLQRLPQHFSCASRHMRWCNQPGATCAQGNWWGFGVHGSTPSGRPAQGSAPLVVQLLWTHLLGHALQRAHLRTKREGPENPTRVQQTPQNSSTWRASSGMPRSMHPYLQHAANLISIVPQAQQTSPSPQDQKGEQREAASQQRYAYMSAWPQGLPALHLPCRSHERLQH